MAVEVDEASGGIEGGGGAEGGIEGVSRKNSAA
jgi:hypothetical protein